MNTEINLDLAKRLLKEYQQDNETNKSLSDGMLFVILKKVCAEHLEQIELDIYQEILLELGEGNEPNEDLTDNRPEILKAIHHKMLGI